MQRILKITSKNPLDLNISIDDKNLTWYFVSWDHDILDEEGNYTIYTYKKTFGEKVPVFKSKDWGIVCNIGNMINGMFHHYFEISNSYPLNPVLEIQ